ncbi:hypothetical protein ACHAWF_016395 [Thalassiosira exigua]
MRAAADSSKRPGAPRSTRTRDAVAVPFNSSLVLISIAAFLSPFATAIIFYVFDPDSGSDNGFHRRHLQESSVPSSALSSALSSAPTSAPTSAPKEFCKLKINTELETTWDAVKFTTFIALAVAFLCILGYELFRRDPIVGKYVYDRKRLVQPDRAPPPLMLSRSLWRGPEGDEAVDDCARITCCKVRPSVLEFLFLNLDKNYVRYSQAAYEARVGREKQGRYACCRRGRYHQNCCTKRRLINSNSGEAVEDDEEYIDEDGYVFYPGYCRDYSHIYKDDVRESYSPQKGSQDVDSLEVTNEEDQGNGEAQRLSSKLKTNIGDLFPEDDPREFYAHYRPRCYLDLSPTNSQASKSFKSARSYESEPQFHSTKSAPDEDKNSEEEKDENVYEDGAPLKYPYRMKYIFMPPGFHTWADALDFLLYFFFLTAPYQWIVKRIDSIPSKLKFRNKEQNRKRKHGTYFIENPGKELTEGDEEFLRCAGLDTYLLVRLARFGFDVTWYPFLSALVVVYPIYYSSNRDPAKQGEYLTLTLNEVSNGSGNIIWIIVFTILLYFYVMRRLWLEWEVFIKLRHNFLANGDTSFQSNGEYRRKYRNTCIVECVPESHRSDTNLYDIFNGIYPDQIDMAEMLIDTTELEKVLAERRTLIEKFDDIDAKYRRWVSAQQGGKTSICCKKSEPAEPMVRFSVLTGKREAAVPYYNKRIQEQDEKANAEYCKLVDTRKKRCHESLLSKSSQHMEGNGNTAQFTTHNLYKLFIPSKVRLLIGEKKAFFHGTGIVTFKSNVAKQSAVQCNLSGLPRWMEASDAPDPRDIFWSNVGVEQKTMENRYILVQFVLLMGILAWGAIVSVINQFTLQTFEKNHFGLPPEFIQGYLPALVVSLILLWIPQLFLLLAMRVIRFKSHTQCDEFVLLWNTGYRLANIFFTFFAISLFQAIQCLRDKPEDFVKTLADGIIKQSSFLLNLIILATGQETMLQLLQWRSLIKQALLRPLINMNARSRRYLDWLKEPPVFERGFIFGFFAPVLSYGLMIAMVFCFMAPIMLGVCAVFFWIASKVHMHNALFVYRQRCEGGGKIFYYWSRIVFITLYSSIVIFSAVLTLKGFTKQGLMMKKMPP